MAQGVAVHDNGVVVGVDGVHVDEDDQSCCCECADGCADSYTVTFTVDQWFSVFGCVGPPDATETKGIVVTRPDCGSAWTGSADGYMVTIEYVESPPGEYVITVESPAGGVHQAVADSEEQCPDVPSYTNTIGCAFPVASTYSELLKDVSVA